MIQSKHTPGPWELVPRETTLRTGDAYAKDGWSSYVEGFDVWACDRERPIVGPHGIPALDTDEANARLIAAAPELLASITECRKQIDSIIEDGTPTDWQMWRDDIDALIAKATA